MVVLSHDGRVAGVSSMWPHPPADRLDLFTWQLAGAPREQVKEHVALWPRPRTATMPLLAHVLAHESHKASLDSKGGETFFSWEEVQSHMAKDMGTGSRELEPLLQSTTVG